MNRKQFEKKIDYLNGDIEKIEEFFDPVIYDEDKYDYQNLYDFLKENLTSFYEFGEYFIDTGESERDAEEFLLESYYEDKIIYDDVKDYINTTDLLNDLLDEHVIKKFESHWIIIKNGGKE